MMWPGRWTHVLPDWPRLRYTSVAGTGRRGEFGLVLRSLFHEDVRDEASLRELERAFAIQAGCRHAFTFGAGRMALFALLEALEFSPGDEILLPGFTCVVVPNALLYRGLRPVYVDIEPRTFNMDPRAVEAAVTPRTRAILVQHTFGVSADVDALEEIASKHGLLLIEDAAHSLGARHRGRLHGALGDAGYFSTDRTKVVNTQLGGVVTTQDERLAERLRRIQSATPFPSRWLARRILLTYLMESILYAPSVYWIGRPMIGALRRLGVLFAFRDELETELPTRYPYPCRMPASEVGLGLSQLDGLASNLAHRRSVAGWLEARIAWYGATLGDTFDDQAWLRYSFLVADRKEFERRLRWYFDLGVWFTSVIYGRESELEKVGYRIGSCPVAEHVARHVVNFPTHSKVSLPLLEKVWRKQGEWVQGQILREA